MGTHSERLIMTPNSVPLLLKKVAVCEQLKLSARALEVMVKAGTFPPPVRMGKHVFWSQVALENWMTRKFGPQEAWRP